MSRVHIEWGNLGRSEALEQDLKGKARKILDIAPSATKLVIHLQVINPINSAGIPRQKVSMELRLPQHQDIRAENEGNNLYKCVRESKRALLTQLKSRKKTQYKRLISFNVDDQAMDFAPA